MHSKAMVDWTEGLDPTYKILLVHQTQILLVHQTQILLVHQTYSDIRETNREKTTQQIKIHDSEDRNVIFTEWLQRWFSCA